MLQSEAGYIDARPHVRQIDEALLQRTAGPYMWVKTRTPPQRAQVRCRQVRTLPWTLGDHVAEPAWAKRKAAEAAKAS